MNCGGFRSPEESWMSFAGRGGVCIVSKDGEVVHSIVTTMN